MPWKMEPKKDVTTCEKHRGAGSELWSGDIRMGKPNTIYLVLSDHWIHRWREGNLGNWNILVPRGKENKLMIPLVAASERGTGQTALRGGVVGLLLELQSQHIVEQIGKSGHRGWYPRIRNVLISKKYPEYGEARETLSESAETTRQA